jgi:hypothetical protein
MVPHPTRQCPRQGQRVSPDAAFSAGRLARLQIDDEAHDESLGSIANAQRPKAGALPIQVPHHPRGASRQASGAVVTVSVRAPRVYRRRCVGPRQECLDASLHGPKPR